MIKPSQIDKNDCLLVYYQNHIRVYFKVSNAKYPDYYAFSRVPRAYSGSVFTEPAILNTLKLNKDMDVFELNDSGISAVELADVINLSLVRSSKTGTCRYRMRYQFYTTDFFLENFGAWLPY